MAGGSSGTSPQAGMASDPVPLPSMTEVPLPTSSSSAKAADINPEHTDAAALREPATKKIITKDGEEIELRRLTPEEKAARRRKKNIIMITVTGLILAVALVIMLNVR